MEPERVPKGTLATQPVIGRLKARGSARSGVQRWKAERLTSVASGLLLLWFIVFVLAHAGEPYAVLRASLASPFNATAMLLFIGINFWHTKLGVQVIVEDYVHHEGTKFVSLVALDFACVVLGALCAVATLSIAFGSPV